MGKPDCYKCTYRGKVPGDAHSRCNHPAFGKVNDNPFAEMVAIFAGVGRCSPIQAKVDGIEVVGHPHGIKNGWFNHPFNFDPTWLLECSGFEEKEEKK